MRSETHKQWDTIRKMRSSISTFERVRTNVPLAHLTLVNEVKGTSQKFHIGGTTSLWYSRFAMGCMSRMGQDVRQDLAVSTALWKWVLEICENKARKSATFNEGAAWIMAGAYLALIYVLSLRGPEGFMFEIALLKEHANLRNKLVWLPIIGKLKGDTNVRTHFLRAVPKTKSGINVLAWRNRLLGIHETAGRNDGPAFCDAEGYLTYSATMNEFLWKALETIWDSGGKDSFPVAVLSREKIRELINLNRTGRRSSDSRATSQGVTVDDREIVNRWSNEERSKKKGKRVSQPLRLSYADQALLDECFRRYTEAM